MKAVKIFVLVLTFVFLQCAGFCADLPTVPTLEARLTDQVQKMIDAGHLAPGIWNPVSHYSSVGNPTSGYCYEWDDTFHNPADTVYTLSIAIPHLPTGMQSAALAYLESEFNLYPPYTYVHTGSSGAHRSFAGLCAELESGWAGKYGQRGSAATDNTGFAGFSFNPFNIYACWKFAELFPNRVNEILNAVQSKVVQMPSDLAYHRTHPHVVNCYIAGYYGYQGLRQLAGLGPNATVQGWLDSALAVRVQIASYSPASLVGLEAGGFCWLVPELGDYLRDNALSNVQQTLAFQDWATPYWLIPRAQETVRPGPSKTLCEGYYAQVYDYFSIFKAHAFILKPGQDELLKYLHAPAFYRGDLYYIQSLVTTLEAGNTPTAVFVTTPAPPIGDAPLAVTFDATDSNDPDGTIVSYDWEFGDGGNGSGVTVSHTYSNPGVYTAKLKVTDNNDLSNTVTAQVIATINGNLPPVAEFTVDSDTGYVPFEVSFDASDSSDPIGSIVSYDWDFDDGNTATGVTTSHTFDQPGARTVTLTVTDDGGATDTATAPITVYARPPARPVPGRIEAEDYNPGGEGIGYHDTTAGNQGDAPQYTDDVDVSVCPEGTFCVGRTATGEWLAFDVNVVQTGNYDITARVSTTYTDNRYITVQIDGNDVATFVVNNTGGWDTYANVTVSEVMLPAGWHELRVVWSINGINLNYLDITPTSTNQPPTVDAGPDKTIYVSTVTLEGSVTDDGQPDPPAQVATTWAKMSGPATIIFGDPYNTTTLVTIPTEGEYLLRLTADDGQDVAYDEVMLTLTDPHRAVTPVTVVNYSFEEPGTEKLWDWSLIPGWDNDAPTGGPGTGNHNTGVGLAGSYAAADGAWTAFIEGQDSFYQQLAEQIVAGRTYRLTFAALDSYGGGDMCARFCYDAGGGRQTIEEISSSLVYHVWNEYVIEFTAAQGEPYIGENLIIEFGNAATIGTWNAIDDVRVDVVTYRLLGDLNNDGKVDYKDMQLLGELWLWTGAAGTVDADCIPDGAVNLTDFEALANEWMEGSLTGDVNGDGEINIADLDAMRSQWLWTGPAGTINEDIIEDGSVDFRDYALLANQWLD